MDVPQAPHCDQSVLHSPGVCPYCDEHPDWQALRRLWGIAFTGQEPQQLGVYWREVPCPSDQRRGTGGSQVWPGNRPEGYRTLAGRRYWTGDDSAAGSE